MRCFERLGSAIEHVPVGLDPQECWPWRGRRNARGYGVVSVRFPDRHRDYQVTRILLGLTRGDKQVARHECDNPPCVNPAHLAVGRQNDNVQDMVDRDRMPRGERRGGAKLTEEAVRVIRSDPRSATALARVYGVSFSLIAMVRRREIWRHLP